MSVALSIEMHWDGFFLNINLEVKIKFKLTFGEIETLTYKSGPEWSICFRVAKMNENESVNLGQC